MMPIDLARLRDRYNERFEAMELVAVEDVFWPVFRHDLHLLTKEFVPLTVVEEGLLRLVQVGLSDPSRCAALLGCSANYVEALIERISNSASGRVPVPIGWNGTTIHANAALGPALESCERADVRGSDLATYRDAIFDHWIDFGSRSFHTFSVKRSEVTASRWLGAQAPASLENADEIVGRALESRAASGEVLECELDSIGHLEWILLHLGCYKSLNGEAGRVLLFNPSEDDQPIVALSSDFEHLLRSGELPPLYFSDDSPGTAKAFWIALQRRIHLATVEDEVITRERHLAKTKAALQAIERKRSKRNISTAELELRLKEALKLGDQAVSNNGISDAFQQYMEALQAFLDLVLHRARLPLIPNPIDSVDHIRTHNLLSVDDCDVIGGLLDTLTAPSAETGPLSGTARIAVAGFKLLVKSTAVPVEAEDIPHVEAGAAEEVEAQVSAYEAELNQLKAELAAAPKTRHLKTAEHPGILHNAIKRATGMLIIISPWIKKKILDQYLHEIDAALRRGCEVWIGYGMPPSSFHKDKSDDSAVRELQRRADETGKLFMVEFSTHEKVLIQDDEQMVTTSFNWFSYDGRDRVRRESGMLQIGCVSQHRETFLNDLKEAHLKALAKSGRMSASTTIVAGTT